MSAVCIIWFSLIHLDAVSGSASWRIPLALQFLPGILLCLGCFLLPPSPRFLILRGRLNDATGSLAKLRLRTPEEATHDPLIQVSQILPKRAKLTNITQLELLEMRVNVALVRHGTGAKDDSWVMSGWSKLFHAKYRARTLIGVMMMFFQRVWSSFISLT